MDLLRFNLDLFGPVPTLSVPPPVADSGKPPGEGVRTAAPATLPDLIHARFSHPRANRQALLCNCVVAFEFRRAKRRSIGFLIGADGLVVRAPAWVPLREIDAAVQEKGPWIVKKLGETQQRQRQLESVRMQWHDGAELLYLGEGMRLRLDPAHGFAAAGAALQEPAGGPRELLLGLAHNASREQIRDAVQAWLMRQARQIFSERLDHFAPLLGVQWKKLSLSNAGTRWGSAQSNGSIRLHWRLVHYRLPVIDYVVAHELSHLRVMDHSPRFWDAVRSVMPDYTEQVTHLKKHALPPWE